MQIIEDSRKCTGCGACSSACPSDAVRMQPDGYDFLAPAVDGKKCTGCGACRKACPVHNFKVQKNAFCRSYAAYAQNEAAARRSSSGGVFVRMAEHVINDLGGVVFGAVFNERMQVEIVPAACAEDLAKMAGSKYVQSSTGSSFREARSFLEQGRYVLYSGLPCQTAGLQSFLGKDYEKLITAEILCHGVPPQGLFQKYIEEMEERHGAPVRRVVHRDGERDWNPLIQKRIRIEFENGKAVSRGEDWDLYMSLYVRGLGLPEACCSCRYASPCRKADITLGDYGGLGAVWKFEGGNKSGVSFVRTNNRKADRFIRRIKGLYMERRPDDEIGIMNPAAAGAAGMTERQKAFLKDYKSMDRRQLFDRYYYKDYACLARAVFKNAAILLLGPVRTAQIICRIRMKKGKRLSLRR